MNCFGTLLATFALQTSCTLLLEESAAVLEEEACLENVALKLLQHRGKKKYDFFNPDPEQLVWDTVKTLPPTNESAGKKQLQFRHGWLRAPMKHDHLAMGLKSTPMVCLRVRGISSKERAEREEPAPLGLLLAHCGGPGSGRECAYGVDLKFKIFDYYDHITLDQRGVPFDKPDKTPADANPVPPCPFKDAVPYPVVRCNELMANESRFEEIVANLKLSEDLVSEVIMPILLAGGLPNSMTTGLKQYNETDGETMLRWWYRLAKLEMELCYANPKYQVSSSHGVSLNAFDHMGTTTLAHDIKLFAASLGQSKLSCWGVSYGTGVCGTFATMFPGSINRLVLDSNTDPKPDIARYVDEASWGPQSVFRGVSTACEQSFADKAPESERCPLAPFMAEKFTKMIKGSDPGVAYIADHAFSLLSGQSDLSCSAVMMSCLGWLQKALDVEAESPNSTSPPRPAGCSPLALGMATPKQDKTTDPNFDRFGLSEIFSVVGLDIAGKWTEEGVIAWWKRAKEDRIVGLSRSLLYAIGLSVWPTTAQPIPPIGSVDVAPLIMGNLRDKQTSYVATQNMRIGFPRGSLLSYQGYGHGMSFLPEDVADKMEATLVNGSLPHSNVAARYACTRIIWAYVVNGTLPTDGDVCEVSTGAAVGEAAAEASLAKGAPCAEALDSLLAR